MRGIDQRIDALGCEIRGKARGAPEAADPPRHRLRHRICGAARKRQRHREIVAAREALGQASRLRGAAENKDASHVAP